jgi:preprotein translocase subunit SecB
MKDVEKTAFSFESYRITRFSFANPQAEQDSLTIIFDPIGTYIEKEGKFYLTLDFFAKYGDKDQHELLSIKIEATFKFTSGTNFDEIPSYFYANSLAIIYPYLRAFVSTLTSLANVKPLILGLLNLSNLEQKFRQNTTLK